MKISICIPTRNRQEYCITAVKEMLKDTSNYFEVIVSDNSDDPDFLPTLLNEEKLLNDSRLKFIRSEVKPLSMRENWERAAKKVSGEWMTFIGDDDYLDPGSAVLLKRISSLHPNIEYVRWDRVLFDWPDLRTGFATLKIPLKTQMIKYSMEIVKERVLSFNDGVELFDGFTPYHAFTKRSLFEKVKKKHDGIYFWHPMVDYCIGYDQVFHCNAAIFLQRPLSVVGASGKSNSAGTTSMSIMLLRLQSFLDECDEISKDTLLFKYASEFVNKNKMAVPMAGSIFLSLIDFMNKNELLPSKNAVSGLIKLLENECGKQRSIESYSIATESCRKFLNDWMSLENTKKFSPKFVGIVPIERVFMGLLDDYLYASMDLGNSQTAAEMYRELNKLLVPIDRIGVKTEIKKNA